MRRLLVTALVAGSAAFVAPQPASAICWNQTLVELTGYCGPCQVAGVPMGAVNHVSEKLTGEPVFAPLVCFA